MVRIIPANVRSILREQIAHLHGSGGHGKRRDGVIRSVGFSSAIGRCSKSRRQGNGVPEDVNLAVFNVDHPIIGNAGPRVQLGLRGHIHE
jgi:hypothetical protein